MCFSPIWILSGPNTFSITQWYYPFIREIVKWLVIRWRRDRWIRTMLWTDRPLRPLRALRNKVNILWINWLLTIFNFSEAFRISRRSLEQKLVHSFFMLMKEKYFIRSTSRNGWSLLIMTDSVIVRDLLL